VILGRDHDEAVGAERIGRERPDIDRSRDDADVGGALGDQAYDLIGEPLSASGRNSVSALVLASNRTSPEAPPA
jgi:hypothetical protein